MASKKQSLAGEGLGLFTDFVQGVRKELKQRGGTDKQLELLRETPVIAAVVNLIMAPMHLGLQFLDRTVSITMDLTKTMDQLIDDGGYDYVNPGVSEHFVLVSGTGTRTTEVYLLCYNKVTTSDQVIVDMDRRGLRPATILELLWLRIQHPVLQDEFPIFALGTMVKVSGSYCVAFLKVYGCLDLDLFDLEREEYSRFAAVRK